jgi:succinate dehydrogenase hydrophobic anchor subunit
MPDWENKWDIDLASPVRRRPRQEVTPGVQAVRALFGLLAIAAAVVGAFMAYNRAESVWVAVFVALIALQVVGRGLADVLTDTKKVRRALYFALTPALATAIFYGTYQAWETWWLSFVVGLIGGAILGAVLAPVLFPRIHREEKEDTASRFRMASGG